MGWAGTLASGLNAHMFFESSAARSAATARSRELIVSSHEQDKTKCMTFNEYYAKVGKASPEALAAAIEKMDEGFEKRVKDALTDGAKEFGAMSSGTVDGAFRTAHLLVDSIPELADVPDIERKLVRLLVVGRCPNASGQAAWLKFKVAASDLEA